MKRAISFTLMFVLTLSLFFPALTLKVSAASGQVYYNIDMSANVDKSRITQKNNTDCALVSVATIEAYMYGATSSADKTSVYNAVVNKNLGTTSGVPRDNAVQSWAALGYNTDSYSLQKLYNQLAKGYPVIVHRTSSAGEHWSVVCGYTGSTTTLQESGFIVVDVGNISTYKMTLSSWKSKYSGTSLDRIAYRKNGIPITVLSGIRIAADVPQVVHPKGDGHGVYGYVASKNTLTSVNVMVVNADTGAEVFSKKITPNAKTYNLFNLDSSMTFASWAAGKYYYVVHAQDNAGNTKVLKKYFTIASSWPSSAPAEPTYTFAYNANGGTGSMSKTSVKFYDHVTLAKNSFTKSGAKFVGWTVKRSSDNKYHVAGQGWMTEAQIEANGYSKSLYADQQDFDFGTAWIKGGTGACTYTFYAQWEVEAYNIVCHNNISQKNYIYDSAFVNGLNDTYWRSRDTSVYTISADNSVKHNPDYATLKVVGTAAGKSGVDLNLVTLTNLSTDHNGSVGDNKQMTLSFWAKSSVSDAEMVIRWGYQSLNDVKTVPLTTSWQYYSIRMDKTALCGSSLHPYFTKAGTFWISELQLEDGTSATDFVNETGSSTTVLAKVNGYYDNLPDPFLRNGYSFQGWYTDAQGGTQVTSSQQVLPGHRVLYARWVKSGGWIEEGDKWYYVEGGKKCTGWKQVQGKWYYLGTDGAMRTGWQKVGVWYYLGTDGAMRIGWQQIDGKWYYMDSTGAMQTGWLRQGNTWYYLDSHMVTGWKLIDNKWYYMDSAGAMQTGWEKIGGSWYYLDSYMKTGWQKIGGLWYYMNSSGVMQTGWLKLGSNWYYLNSSGVMLTGTQVIDGVTYQFNSNGLWIS